MQHRFHTEKAHYRFTLTERADGRPYFRLEPYDRDLSIVQPPGWLGLELRPEITYEQAEAAWKTLANLIHGLSYARPEEIPDEAA